MSQPFLAEIARSRGPQSGSCPRLSHKGCSAILGACGILASITRICSASCKPFVKDHPWRIDVFGNIGWQQVCTGWAQHNQWIKCPVPCLFRERGTPLLRWRSNPVTISGMAPDRFLLFVFLVVFVAAVTCFVVCPERSRLNVLVANRLPPKTPLPHRSTGLDPQGSARAGLHQPKIGDVIGCRTFNARNENSTS